MGSAFALSNGIGISAPPHLPLRHAPISLKVPRHRVFAGLLCNGPHHHGITQRREKSRSRLFRRPRHLDHPEVAADRTRRRSRHLHRRSRPGRRAGAGAQEGRDDGHQGNLHRGRARGVRAGFRLPDVPRQCRLRRRLPARHLDRPSADLQAPDRDRPRRPAPMRSPMARPARATTRFASSFPPMR